MSDDRLRESRSRRLVRWLGKAAAVVSGWELLVVLHQSQREPADFVWVVPLVLGLATWRVTRAGAPPSRPPRGLPGFDAWMSRLGWILQVAAAWNAVWVIIGFDWSVAGTPEQDAGMSQFLFWMCMFLTANGYMVNRPQSDRSEPVRPADRAGSARGAHAPEPGTR